MSELIGESHIKHEIVHRDYIQMHKAELQLIIMKNDIFGTFTFWLDIVFYNGVLRCYTEKKTPWAKHIV